MGEIHKAAAEGKVPELRRLIKEGADVNARDSEKQTPLHLAAFHWRVEAVQVLIAEKADVNATDCEGNTPMHLAIAGKNDPVDDRAVTPFPITPKQGSVRALPEHVETVLALQKAGADIDLPNGDGQTPRQLAEKIGLLEIERAIDGWQ